MPKNTAVEPQVKPSPDLKKRSRRLFTTEYKLSIIQQVDDCRHGELGTLLRREKLYSNQLAQWRREFADNGVKSLQKSTPGPASTKTPEQKHIEQLEKANARLHHQLDVKDSCIMLQKKPSP
ncbi:transposase [Celerinatantimonas yamalensis]|uniref:Transposase n=1 Tax=Celerinatantimonas yamalensis TaxID=559956 RepID=A0ABW9G9L7_9GAMM